MRWRALAPGTYRRTWISPSLRLAERACGVGPDPGAPATSAALSGSGRRHVPVPSIRSPATRPASRMTSRSPSNSALSRSCETTTVAMSRSSRNPARMRREADPRLVVQSRVGLVEHEQHGIANEQASQSDPSLLASRQLVDPPRAHGHRIQPDRSHGSGRPILVGAVGDVGQGRSGG